MANQLIVPGSASSKGNADFWNSATSFSLPGFASRGTYKASLDIVYSHIAVDMDVVHTPRISRSTARYQSQSLPSDRPASDSADRTESATASSWRHMPGG